MQERVLFDVYCLVNADYRQIAKRVLNSNRNDLSATEVAKQLNDHINANTPMLLAKGKKIRYWNSLMKNMPPWANEVYLYVEGLSPDSENLTMCEEHKLYHLADSPCPLCEAES